MDDTIRDFLERINRENILFFDLDGTLVDTNYANYLSYMQAINSVTGCDSGIAYNPKERFTRESLEKIVPGISKTEYEKIIQIKEEVYFHHLQKTQLNKLVSSVLMHYFKSNDTILVSNSRKDRVFHILKHHKLADSFSNIYCRDIDDDHEENRNKYRKAIVVEEIEPSKIIVFENDDNEIGFAISAGIPVENIWSEKL